RLLALDSKDLRDREWVMPPKRKSGSVHFPEPRFSRKPRAEPSFAHRLLPESGKRENHRPDPTARMIGGRVVRHPPPWSPEPNHFFPWKNRGQFIFLNRGSPGREGLTHLSVENKGVGCRLTRRQGTTGRKAAAGGLAVRWPAAAAGSREEGPRSRGKTKEKQRGRESKTDNGSAGNWSQPDSLVPPDHPTFSMEHAMWPEKMVSDRMALS